MKKRDLEFIDMVFRTIFVVSVLATIMFVLIKVNRDNREETCDWVCYVRDKIENECNDDNYLYNIEQNSYDIKTRVTYLCRTDQSSGTYFIPRFQDE